MAKSLKDILYKANLLEVAGSTELVVEHITMDSREVSKGSLFVAIKGTQVDGHQFIQQAVNAGAVAVICEDMPTKLTGDVSYIKVKSSSETLGIVASNFYGDPSGELQLVGVTGTNGKTTVATLLYELFTALGYKVGLISTIVNRIGTETHPVTHTTPNAVILNGLLADMVEQSCEYCFMEVSSHAIKQHRVTGLKYVGGVFTNITHEHLDYHSTFKEYLKVKKRFFDDLHESAFALTNLDDKNGTVILQGSKARKKTYALKAMADFRAKVLENSFTGLIMQMGGAEVHSPLVGEFNAYNLLAAFGVASLLEQDKVSVLTLLSKLSTAEGRFENVISDLLIIGIIDYAHTPDALENVLGTIKKLRTGNEKLITLVGCGGDRDASKRPLMAAVACKYSDQVLFTSDNPRSEEPQAIIDEMQAGVSPDQRAKVLSIPDRKEAIRTACQLAESGDIILLAGKGHEKYQETKGKRIPFDDKLILEETFREMKI